MRVLLLCLFVCAVPQLVPAESNWQPDNAGEYQQVVCNTDQSYAEPTVGEILAYLQGDFQSLPAIPGVETWLGHVKAAAGRAFSQLEAKAPSATDNESSIPAILLDSTISMTKRIAQVLSRVANLHVSVTDLYSDGQFVIDLHGSGIDFQHVHLIQENLLLRRALCTVEQFAYSVIGTADSEQRKFFCNCDTGEPEGASAQYCRVHSVCKEDDMEHGGLCRVNVDPFRKVCVYISSGRNSEGAVTYQRVVPRHTGLASALKATINHFATLMEGVAARLEGQPEGFEDEKQANQPSSSAAVLAWLLRAVSSLVLGGVKQLSAILDPVLSFIPFYPVNLLVGLMIGSLSYELASSRTLHYVIGALLGFLVALLWVGIVIYRYSQDMLKKSVPYGDILFGGGLASVSVALLQNSQVRSFVLQGIGRNILLFWSHGVFGVPWLGKAYFILSCVFGVAFVVWMQLFKDSNSTSYQLLRYLIKACGAVLVLYGLPSHELAQCASLIVLFFPSIQSAVERIAMEAQSSLETYVYSGQRLTLEQYEEQGRQMTTKSLQELRQHMLENPRVLQKLHVQSGILAAQFTAGNYAGIPHREELEEAGGSRTRMGVAFGLVMLGVVSVIGLYYLSKFF